MLSIRRCAVLHSRLNINAIDVVHYKSAIILHNSSLMNIDSPFSLLVKFLCCTQM